MPQINLPTYQQVEDIKQVVMDSNNGTVESEYVAELEGFCELVPIQMEIPVFQYRLKDASGNIFYWYGQNLVVVDSNLNVKFRWQVLTTILNNFLMVEGHLVYYLHQNGMQLFLKTYDWNIGKEIGSVFLSGGYTPGVSTFTSSSTHIQIVFKINNNTSYFVKVDKVSQARSERALSGADPFYILTTYDSNELNNGNSTYVNSDDVTHLYVFGNKNAKPQTDFHLHKINKNTEALDGISVAISLLPASGASVKTSMIHDGNFLYLFLYSAANGSMLQHGLLKFNKTNMQLVAETLSPSLLGAGNSSFVMHGDELILMGSKGFHVIDKVTLSIKRSFTPDWSSYIYSHLLYHEGWVYYAKSEATPSNGHMYRASINSDEIQYISHFQSTTIGKYDDMFTNADVVSKDGETYLLTRMGGGYKIRNVKRIFGYRPKTI